jgi:Mg2+ and Co2+ transporter CorA
VSDNPTDLIVPILRQIQADIAEIKATMAMMATKTDIVALRREMMAMRASLVADIRSEFALMHDRLDAVERKG